jgi:hypothetical protein
MDRLRQSIEHLAAPICSARNVEMGWFESSLVPAENAIRHVFACPRCNGRAETKTPVTTEE